MDCIIHMTQHITQAQRTQIAHLLATMDNPTSSWWRQSQRQEDHRSIHQMQAHAWAIRASKLLPATWQHCGQARPLHKTTELATLLFPDWWAHCCDSAVEWPNYSIEGQLSVLYWEAHGSPWLQGLYSSECHIQPKFHLYEGRSLSYLYSTCKPNISKSHPGFFS